MRASRVPSPRTLLRFIYLGRVSVAVAMYLSTALKVQVARPLDILVTSVLLLATLAFTGGSYWHTHFRNRAPGRTFLYLQALFDIVLVTTVVHVTGGPDSGFSTLYVPLIAVTAAFLGTTAESYLGATMGTAGTLDNEMMNFINTAAGAGAAVALCTLVLI